MSWVCGEWIGVGEGGMNRKERMMGEGGILNGVGAAHLSSGEAQKGGADDRQSGSWMTEEMENEMWEVESSSKPGGWMLEVYFGSLAAMRGRQHVDP